MNNETKSATKGITLIALVVTIVVLIILATVSINIVIGKNGLIKRAEKASDISLQASEREYLLQNVLLVQLDEMSDKISSERLGDELNPRSLKNSYTWHIVKVNDKSYETGWNYVGKGTELQDYGTAKYSWLVNYETGEIIYLEEGNYINLSAGDMLAVKDDSLIINVDSSIIDNNEGTDKESLAKQLGDNVELYGFDTNTDESGLTSTSFNFDGVNDYIKVKYDSEEQKKRIKENGFTFEYYGTWAGGKSYQKDDKTETNSYKYYSGLFCYGRDNLTGAGQLSLRFGIRDKGKIIWNAGYDDDNPSDFCDNSKETSRHNILYTLDDGNAIIDKPFYLTISVDVNTKFDKTNDDSGTEYFTQTVYLNGKELYKGGYNVKAWDTFCNTNVKDATDFYIGKSAYTPDGTDCLWHYSKMNAYCLRLYSRGLSKEEVEANYNKSVAYHNELIKE